MYRGCLAIWTLLPARAWARSAVLLLGLGALRVATLEALDASTRVHQLLLAGVEGMALRAELDPHRRHGRAGHELVAARAVHLALDVVGMNLGLHGCSILAVTVIPPPWAPWRSRRGTGRCSWWSSACR